MAGIDHYTAIRLIALQEVVNSNEGSPSDEYTARKIFYWYSQTFHTPLHQVYDLCMEDVLQAYYEMNYAGIDDVAMEKELWRLTRTDAEKHAERIAKDSDELYFYEAESAGIADLELKLEKQAKELEAKLSKAPVARREKALKRRADQTEGAPVPEFENPTPPEIRMSFISEAEMEKLAEEDSLGPIPPLSKSLLGID